MERPPFSLPQAKSVIFIYTQSHETIMFMEYQMQANTVVLSRAFAITRGMHKFSATIHSFRSDIWTLVNSLRYSCVAHWVESSLLMLQLNVSAVYCTTAWQHQYPPDKHQNTPEKQANVYPSSQATTCKVPTKCINFLQLIC